MLELAVRLLEVAGHGRRHAALDPEGRGDEIQVDANVLDQVGADPATVDHLCFEAFLELLGCDNPVAN